MKNNKVEELISNEGLTVTSNHLAECIYVFLSSVHTPRALTKTKILLTEEYPDTVEFIKKKAQQG